MISAGRSCPADYALPPKLFEAEPCGHCDTLYVAGGIYGNPEALKTLALLADEENASLVVVNGDMHWFDKTAQDFIHTERLAEPYIKLIGNVEAELRRETDIGAGCGCAYPDCVSQEAVERSNLIHRELKEALAFLPEYKAALARRPGVAVVEVGKQRVAISHGDEQFLAGWECSRESLAEAGRQTELARWMSERRIDVLATTHTCAPAALAWGHGAVINNGAAGMPNFKGQFGGLITRIAALPHQDALYRGKVGGLYIEALPLRYDHEAFIRWFDDLWPQGSPGEVSYRERIVQGTEDEIEDALLGGFLRCNNK